MKIKKSFKYKLRPNQKQATLFAQFAGACRWVYNRGLEQRTTAWKERGKSISLYQQNVELTSLKCAPETAWLADVLRRLCPENCAKRFQPLIARTSISV